MIEVAREDSHAFVEDGDEKFVLRPKVLVKRLVTESGLAGDVADGGLQLPGSLDQDQRRLDQSSHLRLVGGALPGQRALDRASNRQL